MAKGLTGRGKVAGDKSKGFVLRGKAVQEYRNPDNSEETWAGRGQPPKWVQAALEKGPSLSDLAISPSESAETA